MADPLSTAASIIAVGQLAASVLSYLHSVIDKNRDCKRLILEVTYTGQLLGIVKDTVDEFGKSGEWSATMAMLASKDGPVQSIQNVLKLLETKLCPIDTKNGYKLANLAASLTWPFTKRSIDEVLQCIERQKTMLLMAYDNQHVQLSLEIKKEVAAVHARLKDVQLSVAELSAKMVAPGFNFQDESVSRFLRWLSPLQYDSVQSDIYSRRHSDSLTWFLDCPEFQTWLSPEGGDGADILFCPGIPGAGKTVLASTVVDYLLETHRRVRDDKEVGIAWVYLRFNARLSQTSASVLGSICAQLLRGSQEAMESAMSRYSPTSDQTADIRIISELLRQCLGAYKVAYLIVDALDEFSEDDLDWMPLVREIQAHLGRSKLLVTSRPIASIEETFAKAPTVHIAAHSADILSYIRMSLEQPEFAKYLRGDDYLRQHVENSLLEKSQGMFLLTKLHVDSLRKGARYSKASFRKAAEELPKQLDQTYSDSIRRINSQDGEEALLAKQLLAWIHLSYSVLPKRILQQALAKQRGLDPSDDDNLICADLLVSVCAGLVILDTDSQVIRLVHYTVAEYLDRCFDAFYPEAAWHVNSTCLRHAMDSLFLQNLMEWMSLESRTELMADMLSASRNKIAERMRAKDERVPFSWHSLIHIEHCFRDKSREPTERSLKLDDFGNHRDDVIYRSWNGLEAAWEILLEWKQHVPQREFDLVTAVLFQDVVAAERLFSLHPFNQASSVSDNVLEDCLAWAAYRGDNEMVTLLLDGGAKPTLRWYRTYVPYPEEERSNSKTCLELATASTRAIILQRWPQLGIDQRVAALQGGGASSYVSPTGPFKAI